LPPPTPPQPTADPVYGVIQRHKELSLAYDTAVNHPDVGDYRPKFAEVNAISDRASKALMDHTDMMWFTFQPTTPSGVGALLRYISTLEDWQMPGGMGEPAEIACLKRLCSTMSNALAAVSVHASS
jgi:hypothetical protein